MKLQNAHVEAPHSGDGGRSLMFWLLIGLAVAVFAPCMILPAWREYQVAELTQRVRAREVQAAADLIARQGCRLDAIHNDPAVVTRLALRELEYRPTGQAPVNVEVNAAPVGGADVAEVSESVVGESATGVLVGSAPGGGSTAASQSLEPVEPPVAVARILQHMPMRDYSAIFCESPTRQTLMVLSSTLFVAAFVIFWPRARGTAVAS